MAELRSRSHTLGVVCASLLALFLTGGCAQNQPGRTTEPLLRHASVHGGQQPVVGATLQLYAVGTSGDGSASTPLLSQVVTSDANGNFEITGAYICPSPSTLVYITATGGNPGLSAGTNNPALDLMAALGPCGDLGPSTFININELTTVGAVWSLAPFMSPSGSVGSSAADSASLAAVFALAAQYVNVSTGATPGTNVPTGFTVPVELMNTLADILSSCVNSAGGIAGDGSACGMLFAATTPNGFPAPTTVLGASLNMANNPSFYVSNLFDLIVPTAPFQPTLPAVPSNLSVYLLVSSGLILSPSQLTFPSVNTSSTSPPQTITVTNAGTKPIVVTGFSFSGANPNDFSALNGCSLSLSPGVTCTLSITFEPSAGGSRTAYLNISSNAANPLPQITLTGTGQVVPPSGGPLTFSASSLNFTELGVPQSVILTNTGTEAASISQITGFMETDNCGTTLAAQSICTFSVAAGPTYAPSITPGGTITISVVNGTASPILTLPSTVTLPSNIVEASVIPIAFGDWAVGTGSTISGQVIELSSMTFSTGISITGPNASDFRGGVACTKTLCYPQYSFGPGGVGLRTATATLSVGGLIGNVSLSGSGIPPGPSFIISPYSPASEPVGVSSGATTLTVTNNGSTQLLLSGISLTGPNANDFNVTSQCGATLNAANSCSLSVIFSPQQLGPRTATLTMTDATSGISNSTSLTGTGQTMIPAITPNPLIFGNVDVGLSSMQTVTITAADGDPVIFDNLAPSNGFALSGNTCAIHTPCQVTVTFNPLTTGPLNNSVVVTDAYAQNWVDLNMSGTGGVAKVSLSASSLTFAARDQGTTSIPQSITLTNTGDIALIVSGITFTGANIADFPIETNTCQSQLAPGANCSVSISFSPTASGARNANLVISSNAATSPDIVQLSGTGN
jgi:hypothetical protein